MLEPIRIVSAWLSDADFGVAPVLALCPLDDGDTRPSAPTIVDETDTAWVAQDEIPEGVDGPVLSVGLAEPIDFDLPPKEAAQGPMQFEWDAVIGVRYHVRGKASIQGTKDAYYVLRAARHSLYLLSRSFSEAASARVRNGVRVELVSEIAMAPPNVAPHAAMIVAGLTVTLRCHDAAPTYA